MLSTKLQTSTTFQAPSTKRLEFGIWNLEFEFCLGFGVWDLDFEIYEG
jgi:hypothetical protein